MVGSLVGPCPQDSILSILGGEGDEKLWVDGDAFPSLFGTGSKDYYGFGYCSPTVRLSDLATCRHCHQRIVNSRSRRPQTRLPVCG
jgi:hypothetical protein